jgi:hypothetical protein
MFVQDDETREFLLAPVVERYDRGLEAEMSIPLPYARRVVLGLVLCAFAWSVQGTEARRQSMELPKEAVALLPKAAGAPTGTWLRLSTNLSADVSAPVGGTTACDRESAQGNITIKIFGDLRPPHLVKVSHIAETEYLQDIAKAEAAAKDLRPAGTENYSKVGPGHDEALPGGRIFYRELVSVCVESGTSAGRTETRLNGFARKDNAFYRLSIIAPMPATNTRALATEILANIQRIELPLGR